MASSDKFSGGVYGIWLDDEEEEEKQEKENEEER
jgi:hypothetical protein